MPFRLKIFSNGSVTYTDWYVDTPANVNQAIAQARWEAPTAKITVERIAGPPISTVPTASFALVGDPDPTLGGDLRLGNHTIIGELEKQTLVIDGGLI